MSKSSKAPIAGVTYYVVQGYSAVKGRRGAATADQPVQARDHDHALRIVERLKVDRAGVVAFRRSGSPETGDWDDAVIIARHGVLPAEIDDMADESGGEDAEAA